MRILFFYPNDYLNIGIPNGIATLSAIAKLNFHQVDIFDTTFIKVQQAEDNHGKSEGIFLPTKYSLEDLTKNDPIENVEDAFDRKINEFKPDLIAVSTMTGTFNWSLNILNRIKPRAKIIYGGVHPSISPKEVLKHGIVDFVCVGEGEELLIKLCECLGNEKDYSQIKNLGYKKSGTTHINELGPFVNLDNLPTPDWSLFDERHLFRPFMGEIYKGSFYEMSRGCPMNCNYCVNVSLKKILKKCGSYFRYQSPQKTIRQLGELKEKYGATWFKFADDSITYFKEDYLEELADGLSKLTIQFGCSIRPEAVTKRKIELLKKMGCVAGTVGIESGNPRIRKEVLNRRISDEQIEETINNLIDANIRVTTFNMIGLPGETREDIFQTIKFNKSLNIEAANVYIIYPYPGTFIHEKYKINIFDNNGDIIPVSQASSFHLSKIEPHEVEGLLKTFNLYMRLPETLWPIIELSEGESNAAKELYDRLIKL
jgi:anaerobic magnesium-protoporphyrin IX monomethyl ester cyclase